ncbi:MAG: hypothetical protein SFU98_22085 [Leptospiraceae bacterium]|nr:hypothetical protein [Leptospiraceae bacterium]
MKIILILVALFATNCETKKSNNNNGAIAAFLLSSQNGCSTSSAASIAGVSRTSFSFPSNCTSAGLAAIGFTGSNLNSDSKGITGTGTSSAMASLADFKPTGEKKQNIEVTFTLNASDAYLEVIGNATTIGSVASGPRFRVKPTTITILNQNASGEATIGKSPPAAGTGTERTYCLEIHEENGAHMFGWSKACSDLSTTERGNYEFDTDGFSSTNPGSKVGFILNKASIKSMIISSGKIGTSGAIFSL